MDSVHTARRDRVAACRSPLRSLVVDLHLFGVILIRREDEVPLRPMQVIGCLADSQQHAANESHDRSKDKARDVGESARLTELEVVTVAADVVGHEPLTPPSSAGVKKQTDATAGHRWRSFHHGRTVNSSRARPSVKTTGYDCAGATRRPRCDSGIVRESATAAALLVGQHMFSNSEQQKRKHPLGSIVHKAGSAFAGLTASRQSSEWVQTPP